MGWILVAREIGARLGKGADMRQKGRVWSVDRSRPSTCHEDSCMDGLTCFGLLQIYLQGKQFIFLDCLVASIFARKMFLLLVVLVYCKLYLQERYFID